MKKKTFVYLFILVFVAGLFVRLYRLDLRPMHHDEANQAYKFGELLEKGEYRYDPADHHGPTLYYLSLPLAWLSGQKSYPELTENTLRGVTVFFGWLLLLILLAAGRYLKTSEKFWAAAFLAVAPQLIYFSRFYIQETLFVLFSLALVIFLWRFVNKPDYREALGLGLFAGLLYATKETSLIVLAASVFSLVLVWLLSAQKNKRHLNLTSETANKELRTGIKRGLLPFFFSILIFLAISFLFYSSFFQHSQGFLDSFRAFSNYTEKAVEAGWHHHGFFYYFSLLFYQKGGPRSPVFSEIPFLVLALVGTVVSFSRLSRKYAENFRSYLAIFALSTALVYSAIPYKTPWNLLVFLAGFLILAGIGFVYLLEIIKNQPAKIILTAAVILWVGWQSYLINYYLHSDPNNPYAYAQTSLDLRRLIARVEELSQVAEEGPDMFIRVISSPEETWPLPWYLRKYNQVGYWTASEQVDSLEPAKIIIMTIGEASKRSQNELDAYLIEYFSLRPDVLLMLGVRNDLWEGYRLRKASAFPSGKS
ncbi:MAG: TIGR03663 family protein [Candidatus Saccharicenans sp.]|nr:TIGR03663 family protein [Candidatus Saccharicenans sp.]